MSGTVARRGRRGLTGAVGPIRVLIVDDSATQRRLIARHVEGDGRFSVVGAAASSQEAGDLLRDVDPQVMTLDIDMPGVDGLAFLGDLMQHRPLPVVMLSASTAAGSDAALAALSLGAVDCLEKGAALYQPGAGGLVARLLAAAEARVIPRVTKARQSVNEAENHLPGPAPGKAELCLIGASTGGVMALEEILGGFPADCPPTAIAQHMPGRYIARFAARLDRRVSPSVRVAALNDRFGRGQVIFAPGDGTDLMIVPDGRGFRAVLTAHAQAEATHCPSIDRLFGAAVPCAGRVLALLLTGMGRDGVEAMGRLRAAGALTLAQDRDSCTVFGMPGAALATGAAVRAVPLSRLSAEILAACPATARQRWVGSP